MPAPLVLLNAVGLTPRLLPLAPRLSALAASGWVRGLREAIPAVTCTAQASILTGQPPGTHGVVANGWLYRDTMEVRFWQQSNRLIQAEPVYETLRREFAGRGEPFKCAKLFWWFNQGAAVDISLTPKPWYGADGNKVFGVAGTPTDFAARAERELGPFPFSTFWGPMAGRASTEWIARATAWTLRTERPDLTLAYLPHLDYDPQRFGPSGVDLTKCVRELDDACAPILDEAAKLGAAVWLVSEYGHCDVTTPVSLNRHLRRAGLLEVRGGPFGETIDFYASRAFAVVDHQLAHVYLQNPARDEAAVRACLEGVPGVATLAGGEARAALGLDHPRSGELVALSTPEAWFAYPYWLDDALAPDFARTVAIHAKPGYDPAELFFDPALRAPKLKAARRLIQKKLGLRTLFDVIPLDASVVRGSHGLAAPDPLDRPLLVGTGPAPGDDLAMTAVRDLLLRALAP